MKLAHDMMLRKASELDKLKIKNTGEKGGLMSVQSMSSGRLDSGFGSDMNISSGGNGFGGGDGFGLSTDVDSSSTTSKGVAVSLSTNQNSTSYIDMS